MEIVKKEKLEETLVANWSQFIDIKLLRDFTQNEVQNNLNNLLIIDNDKRSINSNKISLSRFYFTDKGYNLWIEFYYIFGNDVAEGTIEAFVPYISNKIQIISIVGSFYKH